MTRLQRVIKESYHMVDSCGASITKKAMTTQQRGGVHLEDEEDPIYMEEVITKIVKLLHNTHWQIIVQ